MDRWYVTYTKSTSSYRFHANSTSYMYSFLLRYLIERLIAIVMRRCEYGLKYELQVISAHVDAIIMGRSCRLETGCLFLCSFHNVKNGILFIRLENLRFN